MHIRVDPTGAQREPAQRVAHKLRACASPPRPTTPSAPRWSWPPPTTRSRSRASGSPPPRRSRCGSWRTSSCSSGTPGWWRAGAGRRAATGSPGRPPRSRWPTSSAPSTGRWPASRATGRRRSASPAWRSRCSDVWIAVRASLRSVLEHDHARRRGGGRAARARARAARRRGRLGLALEGDVVAARRRARRCAPCARLLADRFARLTGDLDVRLDRHWTRSPSRSRSQLAATRPSTVTVGEPLSVSCSGSDLGRDDALAVGVGEQRLVPVAEQPGRERGVCGRERPAGQVEQLAALLVAVRDGLARAPRRRRSRPARRRPRRPRHGAGRGRRRRGSGG